MRHEVAKVLTFPVPFPDEPAYLMIFNVKRDVAHDKLGQPHRTEWEHGLGECDYWAFEYACGLQVVYQYFLQVKYGIVVADSPEVDHVLRHCPLHRDDCIACTRETLAEALGILLQRYPFRESEIRTLYAFQVWRQDDNDNVFAVGGPTSERDARCWVQQLEALGHKQMYWYTPAVPAE